MAALKDPIEISFKDRGLGGVLGVLPVALKRALKALRQEFILFCFVMFF